MAPLHIKCHLCNNPIGRFPAPDWKVGDRAMFRYECSNIECRTIKSYGRCEMCIIEPDQEVIQYRCLSRIDEVWHEIISQKYRNDDGGSTRLFAYHTMILDDYPDNLLDTNYYFEINIFHPLGPQINKIITKIKNLVVFS